ncbi:MAG: excinuclease ABC subunit UvrA [bacterium]|nr:excinuclease ABC subunit UvrA [bacterium]
MSDDDKIRLRGVRVHNLRSIDVELPRNRMTVISGVSGSGKSSLAFDTLYAEGRRRYVECLSTYMQQFLDRMARPELDEVSRLPPAIAIERAVPAAQARSTVGTSTEIHDYLRLLFARVGRMSCVDCGRPVETEAAGRVARDLIALGGKGTLSFEIEAPARDDWNGFVEELQRDGFVRLWRDGETLPVEGASPAEGRVEVVVDRLSFVGGRRARIAEAVETAYRFGHDRCIVRLVDGATRRFSRRLHCPDCDREYRPPEPNLFSPNSPLGACPECQGFGRSIGPDLERIVPDPTLTLAEGPIDPWNKPSHREAYDDLRREGRRVRLPWNVPYAELSEDHRRFVEEGDDGFYGIRGFFRYLERKTYKVHVRVFLARYRAYVPCAGCGGSKLRPEARAVRIEDHDIAELSTWAVERLYGWVGNLKLERSSREIAASVLAELRTRLSFLVEVGLGYLTLERPSRTLSGGEAQRIQLARSLGSALVDTLYVLDEPSTGLHPRDVERLLRVLCKLRDSGNTVVVVEHDPRVIREADWLIDLGPGAGSEGGRVLYQGAVSGLRAADDSRTGEYLRGRRKVPFPRESRAATAEEWIEIDGASVHNLCDVTARFPREALTVVTGVSGSGKSSLVHDTLYGALRRALGETPVETGPFRALRGIDGLSAVELVDQSAIGRSPRSNPVTYVKAFDGIRKRFAATREARARGLGPGYFSFNVPGGRCEVCEGAGAVTVEMHFLPDMLVPCESCGGARFGPAALQIRDRRRNVAQVLELTVREALDAYSDVRDVARRLAVLDEIGLGYLRLGQAAPTLSGGEAQRLKLAAHLGKRGSEPRVFLLDEPTTGLHLSDVAVLVRLLRRLVDAGHSVIVVEHHLDLIRAADWVVDLGPGPGADGGRIVAEGTPRRVARSSGETGRFLSSYFKDEPTARRSARLSSTTAP